MCGVFATQAQAETITIKVHHFLNANSVQHTKMLRGWCDNIAKDSANRLQCQIFPSMQLGGTPAQLYDQARDGVADVVWTLPGYTAGRFPRVEVFELPFTMTNAEATSSAAWEYYEKHAKDEFKDTKIEIQGHTDNVGGFDSNMTLSKARAASVVDALVKQHGIAASRLMPHGASSIAPVATNRTDAGRAENRRVELVEM